MASTGTRRALLAGLAAALTALAAQAGDMGGSGWLDDVDPERRTLQIGKQTYRVTAASELRGVDGDRVGFAELEELNHPWVSFAARSGAPDPVLEKLRVLDLDSDE